MPFQWAFQFFFSLRCWTDRGTHCALGKRSHYACYRLKVTVFHDAFYLGRVIDILKRIAGDDDQVSQMAGLERAKVLRQTVSLRWQNCCSFECLPWSATILDLSAQVQVKARGGQVEWRVRSCENDAASVENGRDSGLFVLEVGEGR